MFNIFGLQIHRINYFAKDERKTMSGSLKHILELGFTPQAIIDVGVADGTPALYENFPNTKYLLIEPLKEYEEAIKDISRRLKSEYIIAAAGAKPGKVIINVHRDLVSTSVYKETEGSHVDGIPREVSVVTIDDLSKERNLIGPYLIKVDVQGAELEVLDGAKRVLEDTEVIILEVQLFQFFIKGPQFYDYINYMKRYGFVVYDIVDGYYRPLDGALAAVDILFVKENGQFRRLHSFATRRQSEELNKNMLAS